MYHSNDLTLKKKYYCLKDTRSVVPHYFLYSVRAFVVSSVLPYLLLVKWSGFHEYYLGHNSQGLQLKIKFYFSNEKWI